MEKRLEEIKQRFADISTEAEAEGADLDALEKESSDLKEERKALLEKIETRKKLLADIADGSVGQEVEAPPERKGEKVMIDKQEIYASEEYRSAFFKSLQGKPLNEAEQRAYASTDSANAIPTLTADAFVEKLKKLAPLLNEITLLRVAGNLKFTTEGTNNAATTHTENTSVSAAADTVVNVTLGGYEFIKIISISKAASTMSIPAFEGWLVQMLARDVARAIDNYIINDTTHGIAVMSTWTTGTNQILNTAGLTYGNIISLIALLGAGYDANAKFLMNKATLWNKVANVLDSAGNPILLKDMANGFAPTILGYPVLIDDYVTTANNAIYLGDFETVVGNLNQDITVDKSTESSFASNAIDYRGTAIFDSCPGNKDAIRRFVTTA